MLGLLDISSKHAVIWSTLGVLGVVGMIAVVSPPRFAKLAAWGGRWIDSNKILQVFDKRIDIDHYVMPFSRLLGLAVLLAVVVLAYVLGRFI
jgi:hypothetical protein